MTYKEIKFCIAVAEKYRERYILREFTEDIIPLASLLYWAQVANNFGIVSFQSYNSVSSLGVPDPYQI